MLRTPAAVEGEGGTMSESRAKAEGRTVLVRYQAAEIAYNNGLKVQGSVADSLLPTPNTMDHLPPRSAEKIAESKLRSAGGYANVREAVVNDLIPTPTTRDFKDGRAEHRRDGKVQTDTVARAVINGDEVSETSWGKFEPAIRRWEAVTGRAAPAPTKPDGRDDTHRLSSKFTEWMMGLPDGWITGVGLKRNDELKACGNGVVPQQAELALLSLLHGVDVDGVESVVHLPTPTVSDMYTADLKSSQMSEGSMHSVSLPRAVNMFLKEGE